MTDYINGEIETDKAIDELSAELKRAEAAAVKLCQNVAQKIEQDTVETDGRQDTGG